MPCFQSPAKNRGLLKYACTLSLFEADLFDFPTIYLEEFIFHSWRPEDITNNHQQKPAIITPVCKSIINIFGFQRVFLWPRRFGTHKHSLFAQLSGSLTHHRASPLQAICQAS